MQAVALGMSIAVALYAAAAQRPTERPPADRFRTAVELVEVDVIVTVRRGKPVRGLTRGDFAIREDGVPVEITSFERIELPEPPRVENQPAPSVESGAVMGHNLRALEGGIYSSSWTSPSRRGASIGRGKRRSRSSNSSARPTRRR